MDSFMLQDEGVRDRIRQAEEFLDPSMTLIFSSIFTRRLLMDSPQMILKFAVTGQTSF